MDKLDYIVLGHAPRGQAITTRYFVKKQNELKQKACAELSRSVLSFVQL